MNHRPLGYEPNALPGCATPPSISCCRTDVRHHCVVDAYRTYRVGWHLGPLPVVCSPPQAVILRTGEAVICATANSWLPDLLLSVCRYRSIAQLRAGRSAVLETASAGYSGCGRWDRTTGVSRLRVMSPTRYQLRSTPPKSFGPGTYALHGFAEVVAEHQARQKQHAENQEGSQHPDNPYDSRHQIQPNFNRRLLSRLAQFRCPSPHGSTQGLRLRCPVRSLRGKCHHLRWRNRQLHSWRNPFYFC